MFDELDYLFSPMLTLIPRAQLFKGQLTPTQGKLSVQVSLFLCSKAFLYYLSHPVIKLLAKRILLNFLLKFSDLKSDFTLTLGYLNPSLNLPRFITQKRV